MNILIEENLKNGLLCYALDTWLAIRLQIYNLFLVLIPSYSLIIYIIYRSNEVRDQKQLVIFLTESLSFAASFITLIGKSCEVESFLVAVERCY